MTNRKARAYSNAEDAVIILMQKMTLELQFNAGHISQAEFETQVKALDEQYHKALSREID
jgi:hypothetical protein